MDTASKRPGSITFFLVGLVLLVTVAGGAVMLYPFAGCPKCEGRGLHRMVDAQGPPDIKGVSFQSEMCDYCFDRKAVNWLKRSRWGPDDAPKPPIYKN